MKKMKKSPRYRDELKRTYYSDKDQRMKLATVVAVRYSDGRAYQSVRLHNGYKKCDLQQQLNFHSEYLAKLSTKLLK